MNNDIKEYITPSGKKRYKFRIYVGKDETTGQSKIIRKRGFKTKEIAEKAYLDLQVQVENGEYSPNRQQRLKFKEVYDKWYPIYSETVKESTLATTKRMIEDHVLPELGNYYIDKISVIKCQNAVNKWAKVAPKTFKKYIRYANKIFKYAVHLEIIDSSPMEKVIRPRIKKSNDPFDDFYNKYDLKTYLIYAKQLGMKVYTFFWVLAYCGLRRGEALALKWKDIDFTSNNETLTVRRTLSRGLNNRRIIQTPKTSSGNRTIDLDAETVRMLQEWKQEQRKELPVLTINQDEFVFNGFRNNYPANVPLSDSRPETWNEKIVEKSGLKHIRIHGFRHTNASLLFEAGVSMQDVKERLGHASIKTTMDVYTHITKKERKNTTQKLVDYVQAQ